MEILIVSGPNHGFNKSAAVIQGFMDGQDDFSVTLTEDKDVLASGMDGYDVCVYGTGFTRGVKKADGSTGREAELTAAQEEGLLNFVRGGKGLMGIHGTGWWIGGQAVDLIGGHANWHPPGLTFTVKVEDGAHPVMQGIGDFEVEDEIYISAYEPSLQILASAEWHGRAHPMVWVKPYGAGRVCYTTLGHGPATFEREAVQTLLCQGARWAGGDGE